MRDVYIEIMRAAETGKGLRLTADEVFALSLDDAISARATNALTLDEFEAGWAKVRRDRTGIVAANIIAGSAA